MVAHHKALKALLRNYPGRAPSGGCRTNSQEEEAHDPVRPGSPASRACAEERARREAVRTVVMTHLPAMVQIIFIVALISALFPSADGALTALTSSTCNDLLRFEERTDLSEATRERWRRLVHAGHAGVFLLLVFGFRRIDDPSMIYLILKIASYTYGPLLGLFAFAILARRELRSGALPWVALAAPALCWLIELSQAQLFGAYRFGLELLLLNAAFTFAGLWAASRPRVPH